MIEHDNAAVKPVIPSTCDELYSAANLPFNEANKLISQANSALVESCFRKIYPNFGQGYLHSSDHYAALVVLLGKEPTFRQVYDSYHSGSKNIDLAREKSGSGLRPQEWDNWSDEQKKYSVLVHLYGISQGSRIFDGKRNDPNPSKTKALMVLWGLDGEPKEPKESKEPDKPVEPDKPIDPVNPIPDLVIEVKVIEGDKVRVFRTSEVKL